MHIGELANATGLSRNTLRFYEKRGLLHPRRNPNGYRDYPLEAVEWLRYMRLAQSLGFTLVEIEAGLPLLANPHASGEQLRAVMARKLQDIDRRISDLSALREELALRLTPDMEQCPFHSRTDA